MINEQFFEAKGRAVLHAQELFARSEGEDERLAAVALLARTLGEHVCEGFRRLTSNTLHASAEGSEVVPQSALGECLGRGAAGFAAYTSGRAAQTIHLSVGIDGLEDSLAGMFGASQPASLGEAPTQSLSPAAALLRDRIARLFGEALTEILGPSGLAYRFVHSGPLPIFQTAGRGQFVVVSIALSGESHAPLMLRFALHLEGVEALMVADRKRRATQSATNQNADPNAGPWGDIELCVTAILSDTRFSLAKLASLEPGAIIPLPINRKVPLVCDGRTLAHGTIGEMDDRIALRITDLAEGTTR